MKRIRTYFDLPPDTGSDVLGQIRAQVERLHRRLSQVHFTLAVLSGKGGVGKSVVTANLAAALAADRCRVGVVDADLNGPCMAKLLGARGQRLLVKADGVAPAVGAGGLKLMSMDLLLASDSAPVEWKGPEAESFVWRGTLEAGALREFLADTDWGALDYLLLDLPPGTDRIEPVHDLLPHLGGVVFVSLASDLSQFVVRKAVHRVRELGIPIVGFVENMAGYACPHCGTVGPLFGASAEFDGVPSLGRVPFDPELAALADRGRPFVLERPGSAAAAAFGQAARAVRAFFETGRTL
ncbi:MAG: P-loop NTPase [Gemmatimonadetes bacterium]|nr:P-loop NTPase [Gemmatimonadota bacterium]